MREEGLTQSRGRGAGGSSGSSIYETRGPMQAQRECKKVKTMPEFLEGPLVNGLLSTEKGMQGSHPGMRFGSLDISITSLGQHSA